MVEVQYDETAFVTIGALLALDAVTGVSKIDAARLNGFRISKIKCFPKLTGKTTAEGPLMFGIAANMSAGQIEVALENDAQSSAEDNQIGKGQAIWPLCMIPKDSTGDAVNGATIFPPEGFEVKLNWSVIEGKALLYWVYNVSGSTVTTGAVVHVFSQIFGVWLRD